jgi:hypothetical protein
VNVLDAAYDTVHEYPGGAEALVTRLSKRASGKHMSAAILRNKVNPNNQEHHLTLVEADEIMGKSNDFRILHALAADCRHVAIPLDSVSGSSVLELVLGEQAAAGTFSATVLDALSDGKVSQNEMRTILAAFVGAQSKLVSLIAKLEQMVDVPLPSGAR